MNGGGGPLEGVTVIDMSSMLMGPYASLLLAEMGARVIKVEPPGGDISRGIDDLDDRRLGPIYLNLNRGKESIELDLTVAEDYALFTSIVAEADVVAHNRPPGSEARLRIDYPSLRKMNPRVIVCAMYGFGADGPYGAFTAYDDVMQGISGIAAHQTGDGTPQYVRTPLTDKITGMLAAGAISAALYERELSGEGQLVEIPMFETMVGFLLAEQQSGFLYDPPRGPVGYARTNSPHRHPLPTSDGLISMLASTDSHWQAVFRILDNPGFASDPRFASIRARTRNIDELYAWLVSEVGKRSTDDVLSQLQEARVPAMRVNAIEDLFEDPHLVATGFFETVEHPEAGSLRQAATAMRFSRSGVPRLAAAPKLGGHDKELRAEFADSESSRSSKRLSTRHGKRNL